MPSNAHPRAPSHVDVNIAVHLSLPSTQYGSHFFALFTIFSVFLISHPAIAIGKHIVVIEAFVLLLVTHNKPDRNLNLINRPRTETFKKMSRIDASPSSNSLNAQQDAGKSVVRTPSAAALHQYIVEHNDELVPLSHARKDSGLEAPAPSATHAVSPGAPGSAAAQAGLVPLPVGRMQEMAENAALTAPVEWVSGSSRQRRTIIGTTTTDSSTTQTEPDRLAINAPAADQTPIYVGKGQSKKQFNVNTATLTQKSPYFRRLVASSKQSPSTEQLSFEEVDEFAMGLFMHWIFTKGKLNGPHDFHSLAHYLGLYVLARKFEMEGLQNQSELRPAAHWHLFEKRSLK